MSAFNLIKEFYNAMEAGFQAIGPQLAYDHEELHPEQVISETVKEVTPETEKRFVLVNNEPVEDTENDAEIARILNQDESFVSENDSTIAVNLKEESTATTEPAAPRGPIVIGSLQPTAYSTLNLVAGVMMSGGSLAVIAGVGLLFSVGATPLALGLVLGGLLVSTIGAGMTFFNSKTPEDAPLSEDALLLDENNATDKVFFNV